MSMHRADSDPLLRELNEPQRQAVTHGDGPLLVVAGPGSGKTRVITRRAAHLVQRGVAARNILAITFTNKAADEMRQRIEALGVRRGMWVYTFHALGVRLLREFGALARLEPGFSIFDEADSLRVIKEAQEIRNISESAVSPEVARALISRAKNALVTAEAYRTGARASSQEMIAEVYVTYERLLEQRNAVDFDDLLMRVAIILRDHPEIAEPLNVRFRHLLIDEYQDTNHAQYLIARCLSQHHGNICATGDPDQSIYAWRGASVRNILEFERDFPDAVVVRLEQNYRSTGRILGVASKLIRANRQRKHKDLWTQRGEGQPVQAWRFRDGPDEAAQIAARIAELHRGGRAYSDFAIVYRINALSRGLEEALRNRGIPYRIARGVEFYNRKEIRDVLAYLRILVNPADDVALLRIINTPPRGIGATTVQRLRTAANEQGRPLLEVVGDAGRIPGLRAAVSRLERLAALLRQMAKVLEMPVVQAVSVVLSRSGLEQALKEERDTAGEDRLANVRELVTAALRYQEEVEEPTLPDFLHRISLVSDQDAVDEQAGCVMLMTLHAAKGLEFPVVFMVGMEHGLLPHERALREGDIEEERRLCFVGMTRAQDELYLSCADERLTRGRKTAHARSVFLRELDDGALVWRTFAFPQSRGHRLGHEDGFEPVVDDLPPEEAARLAPQRRRYPRTKRPVDREARSCHEEPATSPFAGWKAGTIVEHDRYGVGQVVWIRPAMHQTRAAVRFAGHGEKVLILERAPVRKLERKPR